MARATNTRAKPKTAKKPAAAKRSTTRTKKPAATKRAAPSKAPRAVKRTSQPSKRAEPTPAPSITPSVAPSIKPRGSCEGSIHPCFIITLRLMLGFLMLWAFFDKLFGLGFSTARNDAWVNGVSPTAMFLYHGTSGPLVEVFRFVAGMAIVDWLFMIGLFGIGVAFMLGVKTRIAAWAGGLMMILMYAATIPPETNPVLTYHLVYAVLFFAIGYARYNHRFDFVRNWWLSRSLVRRHRCLE